MARKAIAKETYRTLFAKTGNQCAFPDCSHVLVDEDDEFVAQICHIEAANIGGERYNSDMSDDERTAPQNLIVLCYRHHKKTDNVAIYTNTVLLDMKARHEALWMERNYVLSDSAIEAIIEEETGYWTDVDLINLDWVNEFDYARPINTSGDPLDWLSGVSSSVDWIDEFMSDLAAFNSKLREQISAYLQEIGYDPERFDAVKHHENPFWNVEWERMNLGYLNRVADLRADLLMLEIHLAYQELKTSPADAALEARLEQAKTALKAVAGNSGVYD